MGQTGVLYLKRTDKQILIQNEVIIMYSVCVVYFLTQIYVCIL